MSRVKCPSPRMRRQPLHSSGVKEERTTCLNFDQILEGEKLKQVETKTQSDTKLRKNESSVENETVKNTPQSDLEDIKQDNIDKEHDCSDSKLRLMEALKHSLLLISPERSRMEGPHEVAGDSSALYRSPYLSKRFYSVDNMDTANVIENTTEGKVDWTKRIDDNVINEEQQKVINELEEVLNFLKGVKIMNDEALVNIKKPLDDLQSSLKYLPIESSFDALPKEMKTHILSYLCDSESFKAASVCQEWKEIVKCRFFQNDDLKIGNHCSNYHECVDNSCFMPGEMLKASMTHKLDIPLTICHPLTEVDSGVVTQGLLSVSNLTITSECECEDDDDDDEPILSDNQLEDYFEGLDKRDGAMEKMELIGVDMTGIDQDKLINCLLNKTKWLTLDEGQYDLGAMFSIQTFVNKLSQISPESKLKYLILHSFEYADLSVDFPDLSIDFADALCQVENVKLHRHFSLETETLERLIENILTRPVKMKSLLIMQRTNYRKLMSPGELLTLMGRMELLVLWGFFTPQQLQAARILPDVEINGTPPCVTLKKGRDEIF